MEMGVPQKGDELPDARREAWNGPFPAFRGARPRQRLLVLRTAGQHGVSVPRHRCMLSECLSAQQTTAWAVARGWSLGNLRGRQLVTSTGTGPLGPTAGRK